MGRVLAHLLRRRVPGVSALAPLAPRQGLGCLRQHHVRVLAPGLIACRAFSTPAGGVGSETHGGDDIHRVSRLVCDFSVTTNALGPVPSALQASKALMDDIEVAWISPRGGDVDAIMQECPSDQLASAPAVEHYPIRTDTELERQTATFLRGADQADEVIPRLLFGNGASELIDLLARAGPEGKYCVNPHVDVQYREYQRAAKNAGREITDDPKDANLLCVVNPNNPTGDFMEREDMEKWIQDNAAPGSWVLVDESMLFWAGPDWNQRGVSDDFIKSMAKRHIYIFLVTSWTKIFACTGMRIGSILCPTPEKKELLQGLQVPWSVNVFARTYLKAAIDDTEYLERTWRNTPKWRQHMVSRLERLHPNWKFMGKPWLSWVWIDTGCPEEAESVYQASLECGCPVRTAKAGYDRPTVVRMAVRRPYDFGVLYQALLHRMCDIGSETKAPPFGTYADVKPQVIEGVRLVHIDDLLPHEEVLQDRAGKLQDYMNDLPVKILPAIIVDSEYQVVIDGHHRLNLFRQMGMQIVPAVSVNYAHEDILVNPPGKERKGITKEAVISTAVKGQTLPPKSTQHMVRSRGGSLLPIIVLAPQIAELANVSS